MRSTYCAGIIAAALFATELMSTQAAREFVPPLQSIGVAAYPEFEKLARFFIRESLVGIPRNYKVDARAAGSDTFGSPFFLMHEPAISLVQGAACESELVVFAVPTKATAFVSANDRWIFTEYELSYVDIVKQKDTKRALTEPLRYIHPGGELNVGGRRASTVFSRYPSLVLNRRHMFFLRTFDRSANYRAVNKLPFLRPVPPARIAALSSDYEPLLFADVLEQDVTDWVTKADCGRDHQTESGRRPENRAQSPLDSGSGEAGEHRSLVSPSVLHAASA